MTDDASRDLPDPLPRPGGPAPGDPPRRLAPGEPPRGLAPSDPPPRPAYVTTPGAPPFGERHVAHDDGPLTPREERTYAALAHLSQVGGLILAPTLVLASLGRRSLFVDRHAKEAFNFQVTYLLLLLGACVVALRGTGPGVIGGVAAYGLIFAVVAALRSWRGALFRYPVAIRFLR